VCFSEGISFVFLFFGRDNVGFGVSGTLDGAGMIREREDAGLVVWKRKPTVIVVGKDTKAQREDIGCK
jgi:hypothetical protein